MKKIFKSLKKRKITKDPPAPQTPTSTPTKASTPFPSRHAAKFEYSPASKPSAEPIPLANKENTFNFSKPSRGYDFVLEPTSTITSYSNTLKSIPLAPPSNSCFSPPQDSKFNNSILSPVEIFHFRANSSIVLSPVSSARLNSPKVVHSPVAVGGKYAHDYIHSPPAKKTAVSNLVAQTEPVARRRITLGSPQTLTPTKGTKREVSTPTSTGKKLVFEDEKEGDTSFMNISSNSPQNVAEVLKQKSKEVPRSGSVLSFATPLQRSKTKFKSLLSGKKRNRANSTVEPSEPTSSSKPMPYDSSKRRHIMLESDSESEPKPNYVLPTDESTFGEAPTVSFKPYTLRVMVVEGKGLLNTEMGFKDCSNPYVKVEIDDQKQTSTVVYKNLNPTWNQTFLFTVMVEEDEDGSVDFSKDPRSITLQVYDHDTIFDHAVMGVAELSLNDVLLECRSSGFGASRIVNTWLKLKLPEGAVRELKRGDNIDFDHCGELHIVYQIIEGMQFVI